MRLVIALGCLVMGAALVGCSGSEPAPETKAPQTASTPSATTKQKQANAQASPYSAADLNK